MTTKFFLTVEIYFFIPPQNGIITSPDSKKRTPAKFSGEVYCKPIFMLKKAVDHKRHAIIARTEVDVRYFFTSKKLSYKDK